MYLLAVETSTAAASVALADGRGAPRCRWLTDGRTQTEELMSVIDRLLREAGRSIRDVDGFAVAVGPGAFVGVRVGIATVKGLALGTGKQVVAVSTLEALAVRALEAASTPTTTENLPPLICPMIDARRGEVYAARFRPAGPGASGSVEVVRLGEEGVWTPADFLATLDGPVLFLGDGAARYRELIDEQLGSRARFAFDSSTGLPLGPGASAVARVAAARWRRGEGCDPADLLPVYFRPAAEPVGPPARQGPR